MLRSWERRSLLFRACLFNHRYYFAIPPDIQTLFIQNGRRLCKQDKWKSIVLPGLDYVKCVGIRSCKVRRKQYASSIHRNCSLSRILFLERKAQCDAFSDLTLCIYIDNSMFQLSPNKAIGIGDCRHVDVNGQVDVRYNVCCLMCVVYRLCLNEKRSLRCYIWKSDNPHYRWFLSLLQSVANGVDDGHCFSAMGWLWLPEFGSPIIIAVIYNPNLNFGIVSFATAWFTPERVYCQTTCGMRGQWIL